MEVYMYYDITKPDVAISGSVHRALNDVVNRMIRGKVSGWKGNYRILLSQDGHGNAMSLKSEEDHFGIFLDRKLVVLPTPKWVGSTEQKVYLCFAYELQELMNHWWCQYAENLR